MKSRFQQATALVQSGFAAQGGGDLGRAQADYQAALACVPEHPTALQLLGMLARRRGETLSAEDLLRRSLSALPAQPHVWNNLGNLLDDTQRAAQALACFDRALELDDQYADAHYNRARVLLAMGRVLPAQAAAERALALSPRATAALLQLKAQIQAEMLALPGPAQAVPLLEQLAADKRSILASDTVF